LLVKSGKVTADRRIKRHFPASTRRPIATAVSILLADAILKRVLLEIGISPLASDVPNDFLDHIASATEVYRNH